MSPCCRLAILRAMGYHIGNGSRALAELAGAFLLPIAHLTSVTIYNHFKAIVTEMGLPEVRFHDLRHTYVNLALQNGVDMKTVSNNLGYATVVFTMDKYVHVSMFMMSSSSNWTKLG